MLNRLSVNVLLKSTIGVLAATIIIGLVVSAWQSWGRLHAAERLAHVAEASTQFFTGLHNLRVDRSQSLRDLRADKADGVSDMLRAVRGAEVPVFKAGLIALRKAELADGQTWLTQIGQAVDRLEKLHAESAAALAQPKAARRADLPKELFDHHGEMMGMLDKVSAQLANTVKLDDAYVDHLMQIKHLAWIVRNAGGDSSVLISNGLAGTKMTPDTMSKYAASLSSTDTAWVALKEVASGLPLPARFGEAVQKANQEFFSPDYAKLRLATLNSLIAGDKIDINTADWVKMSVAKLASLLNVAEVALQTVRDHAAERRSIAQWRLTFELILLAGAGGLTLAIMLLITRRVTMPLNSIQNVMLKLADGNFNVSLPQLKSRDEVAQIVSSVNTMVDQVRSAIGEIKASGREVTNASAEISTSTTDLSQRTEEQAASLEETSAAMEELSATVKKNAENAQLANTDANNTRDVADRGGKVVAQAVEAMAKIEDSSRKISDIIGVIDEIARQTNLLALNAAVEAARAGEAGRGFAVVASEVRSLAQRSSQAAKDIKDLITSSNGQVKDGVALVNRAGESLSEIVESIKKVAAGVSDIANASIEQATGIEQINKALTQMDEVTQQNSALVEENAATAKTLENQAQAMDGQVAFFQVEGDTTVAAEPKRAAGQPTAQRQQATQRRARAA